VSCGVQYHILGCHLRRRAEGLLVSGGVHPLPSVHVLCVGEATVIHGWLCCCTMNRCSRPAG
jgi:hypothetical protein